MIPRADAAAAGARARATPLLDERAVARCSTCAPAASTSPSSRCRRSPFAARDASSSARRPALAAQREALRAPYVRVGVAVVEWRDGEPLAGRAGGGAVCIQAPRLPFAASDRRGLGRAARSRSRYAAARSGAWWGPSASPAASAGGRARARPSRSAGRRPCPWPLLRRAARSTPRPCAARSTAGRSPSPPGRCSRRELDVPAGRADPRLGRSPRSPLRRVAGSPRRRDRLVVGHRRRRRPAGRAAGRRPTARARRGDRGGSACCCSSSGSRLFS